MIKIRTYNLNDWPGVWAILETVFRAGETYAYSPEITEMQAQAAWTSGSKKVFVAEDSSTKQILGSYYLKANHEGPGAHVCNCGYVVSDQTRGKGIASLMCEHSQDQAIADGFRSMQFNFVAASNEGAVRLWKKLGFGIVGTIPEAFKHPKQGYVDAYIMYKHLNK